MSALGQGQEEIVLELGAGVRSVVLVFKLGWAFQGEGKAAFGQVTHDFPLRTCGDKCFRYFLRRRAAAFCACVLETPERVRLSRILPVLPVLLLAMVFSIFGLKRGIAATTTWV